MERDAGRIHLREALGNSGDLRKCSRGSKNNWVEAGVVRAEAKEENKDLDLVGLFKRLARCQGGWWEHIHDKVSGPRLRSSGRRGRSGPLESDSGWTRCSAPYTAWDPAHITWLSQDKPTTQEEHLRSWGMHHLPPSSVLSLGEGYSLKTAPVRLPTSAAWLLSVLENISALFCNQGCDVFAPPGWVVSCLTNHSRGSLLCPAIPVFPRPLR